MTSRLCTGKSLTFFYSVTRVAATNMLGRNLLFMRLFSPQKAAIVDLQKRKIIVAEIWLLFR